MPKYNTTFHLDMDDLDRIERSLTSRVGTLTRDMLHRMHRLVDALVDAAQACVGLGTFAVRTSTTPVNGVPSHPSRYTPALMGCSKRPSLSRSRPYLVMVFKVPDRPEVEAVVVGDPHTRIWHQACMHNAHLLYPARTPSQFVSLAVATDLALAISPSGTQTHALRPW